MWGAAKGLSDEIRWFGSCHKGAHQPMFVGAWNTLLCLEGDAFRAATYVLKTWHEKANDTTSGKNVCCDGIPLQRPAIAAVHDLVLHVVGPGGYERALRSWIMRVRRVRMRGNDTPDAADVQREARDHLIPQLDEAVPATCGHRRRLDGMPDRTEAWALVVRLELPVELRRAPVPEEQPAAAISTHGEPGTKKRMTPQAVRTFAATGFHCNAQLLRLFMTWYCM